MGESAGGHVHLRALGWLLTEEQVRRLGAADSPGRGQDPREGVLEEVLLRPEGLLEKALESVGFRTVLAENPHTPPAMLARLGKDENDHVRMGVARNPMTPVPTLVALASDRVARLGVATNPCAHPEILARLARDPDLEVRRATAYNPRTPAPSLHRLLQEGDLLLNRCLAANPGTPPKLMKCLARGGHLSVLRTLVRNPSAPQALLQRLAGVDDPVIRTLLAQHPNLPQRPDTEHPESMGRRVRVASVKTIRPAPVCAGEGGDADPGSSPGA